jgi:hypothetical protein
MAFRWETNGSFLPALTALLRAAFPGWLDAFALVARVLAGLLVLGVSLWLGLRGSASRRESADAETSAANTLPRDLYVILLVLLLASPVVMPWYVLWLIPWLCFHPAPSGFVFSLLVPLSYLLSTQRFPLWLQVAEYLPVYALFARELLSRRGKGVGC